MNNNEGAIQNNHFKENTVSKNYTHTEKKESPTSLHLDDLGFKVNLEEKSLLPSGDTPVMGKNMISKQFLNK